MGHSSLLTGRDVESRLACGRLPTWAGRAFAEFKDSMLSKARPFPCTFGIDAFRSNGLRYVIVDKPWDERSLQIIGDTLSHYLGIARTIHRYTSMVVFFEPLPERWTVEDYRATFWKTLQYLHQHDPKPWPPEIPTDPDDPQWEFCFAGQPTFVVCNTPAHLKRVSRHSAGLIITFQPRWVFDDLRANPQKARRATSVIRARLEKYDAVPIYHAMGAYGDPNNREWKQYFLPDVESPGPGHASGASCPLAIHRGSGRGETVAQAHG